jgi:hypothetical protein
MTVLVRASISCKRQTHLLVRKGTPHQKMCLFNSNKDLVLGPRWVLDTKIGWPTDFGCELSPLLGATT